MLFKCIKHYICGVSSYILPLEEKSIFYQSIWGSLLWPRLVDIETLWILFICLILNKKHFSFFKAKNPVKFILNSVQDRMLLTAH